MVDNKQNITPAESVIPETNAVAAKPEDVVKKGKGNKVEIDANTLKSLLDRVENLTQTVKEHEQSFGQDQMAKIERLRASGKLVKSVRLNTFNGKIISSWKMIKDDVFIDNTGKEQAIQQIAITFKDGEVQELPMIEFSRRKTQIQYEVIRESREADGSIMSTVLLEGGEEFTINNVFVN
jgi:hypothetical protein